MFDEIDLLIHASSKFTALSTLFSMMFVTSSKSHSEVSRVHRFRVHKTSRLSNFFNGRNPFRTRFLPAILEVIQKPLLIVLSVTHIGTNPDRISND